MMAGPITLGRSDAILARNVIATSLIELKGRGGASAEQEALEDLLQFIDIQLDSIAQEEIISPMRHIWKPM